MTALTLAISRRCLQHCPTMLNECFRVFRQFLLPVPNRDGMLWPNSSAPCLSTRNPRSLRCMEWSQEATRSSRMVITGGTLRPLTVAGKANSRTTLRCGKARSRSSKSTPILLPPWRPTRGQLRSEQNIDDRGYCACRRCDQSCPG